MRITFSISTSLNENNSDLHFRNYFKQKPVNTSTPENMDEDMLLTPEQASAERFALEYIFMHMTKLFSSSSPHSSFDRLGFARDK